jgi:hypothetical protein
VEIMKRFRNPGSHFSLASAIGRRNRKVVVVRPKPRVLLAIVGTAVCVATAVQGSPNFSSLTAEVKILTADSPYPLRVTIPMPYREEQRIIRAPVPADEFDEVWPDSAPRIGMRTDRAAGG